jgi:tripartite-type tricarboxylate transporter receptor subunit TctC
LLFRESYEGAPQDRSTWIEGANCSHRVVRVRALAVARGERWPTLLKVPTLVESGYPDFAYDAWTGVVAPAGTPPEIIAKLNAAINAGLTSEASKATLAKFSAFSD